ncbi:MAG: tetratricopeptide repeat-containing sensor histidine kinase [Chloroherpetonaceae bacterium]
MPEKPEVALSNDPGQIRVLALLARDFRSTNLLKARETAEACLTLIGESSLYAQEKALALTTLGVCNRFDGNAQKAIEQFSEAQLLYLSLNDSFNVADSYLKLGSVYRYLTDYENALQCYEKGLAMFRELNDANGTAMALNNLGNVFYSTTDYARALQCYQESLSLYLSLGDDAGIASTFANLALIYERLGDYVQALQFNQESLKLREKTGDKKGMSISLNNIGMVYEKLSDFPNAISTHEQSLQLKRDIGDLYGISQSLNNLGNVYEKMGERMRALDYYTESLSIQQSINDKQGVAYSLNNIGHIHETFCEFQDALRFYNEGLSIFRSIGDKYGVANSLIGLGKVLIHLKAFSEAEQYLNDALSLCEEVGLKEERYVVYETLSLLYAETSDFQKAFEAYKKFHSAKEEVHNQEKEQRIATLQVRFETEQARKDSELQKKEAELFRLKTVELANALNEVQLQKERAEEANKLKTEFLGIAAHDLKNPLQSIMGFADLIAERIDDKASVLSYSQIIKRSSERMFNIVSALLKNLRYDATQLSLNPELADVGEVLRLVLEHNLPQIERKSLLLLTELEPNCTARIDLVYMSEAFDNLISNAIKYSPSGKHITVSLQRASNSIRIAIKDEGQGLTEDDKTKLFIQFQSLSAKPTGGESSTGLGLYIVKQIVEKHGGRVWAESSGEHQGATFFIELPCA